MKTEKSQSIDLKLNFEYNIENIDEKIKVCVTKDHTFGTDAVLLSKFIKLRKKDKICDLGTGCGIIPLMIYKLYYKIYKISEIYGVDIQPKAIEQFKESIRLSGLEEDIIRPVCADLKDLKGIVPHGIFDSVVCNPPYKTVGTGLLSESVPEQIARHEILCTVFDVCHTASKLLKTGGSLYICQRPERLTDVLHAMRSNNIEPKLLQFVAKSHASEPWLFLIEGRKCSKPFMRVLPVLETGG